MKNQNADTAAASAVANASVEENIQSGFLPEDKNYRLTGKFSDEKSSDKEDDEKDSKTEGEQESDEKSADTEAASAAAAEKEKDEKDADTAAASAAATTQEQEEAAGKTSDKSQNRYRKLSRENRELREQLARYQGREEGRSTTQTTRETEQKSQAATDGKTPRPQIDDVDEKTGKAKYATYADYETAKDEWLKKETLREFQEHSTQSQRQQQMQAAEAEIGKALAKKFETARTKYKDFDEVALNNDLVIPKGSVADAFLIDSDHAADVLYHLGKHPEILEGFYGDHNPQTGKFVNKLTPQQQFRKLMAIEAEVSKQKPASAKPVTQAPRPANQVDGRNAVTKDAIAQAVDDGDTETYIREQNARDLARRKKG